MTAPTVFGDGTLGFMSLNNSDSGTRPDGHDSHVMSDSSVGRTETPPDEVSSSIFDDLPSSTAAASEGRLGLNKMADPPTDIVDAASLAAAASSAPTPSAEPAEGTTGAEPGAGTGAETGASGESSGKPTDPPAPANEPDEFSFPRPVFDTTVPIPIPEDGGLAALDVGGEPVLATEPVPAPAADAAGTEPVAGEAELAAPDAEAATAPAAEAIVPGAEPAAASDLPASAAAPAAGAEGRTEGDDPYATFVFPHAGSQPLTSPELPALTTTEPSAPPAESTPAGEAGPGGEAGEAAPPAVDQTSADQASASPQTLETLPDGFPLPVEEAAAFGAAALGAAVITGAAPAAGDEGSGEAPWHSSAASESAFSPDASESAFSSDTGPSTSRLPASARPAPKRDTLKIALISYAVLSTIAAGILFKRLMDKSVREDRLESLPDMPVLKSGQVKVMQQDVELNPGHKLRLGEKRRFGNIEVEPVRLTRGMVEYVNPVDPSLAPLPEGPVVKLWIRFRNVSQDQTIPVLDRYLVYTKQPIGLTPGYQTNNFVARASDHRAFGYMLTHPHTDQNVLKGQELGHELAPGETMETFIPSTPLLDLPDEELLWRFHLRKGLSKSGRGVTTLIDVAFRPEEISDEASPPQEPKRTGFFQG